VCAQRPTRVRRTTTRPGLFLVSLFGGPLVGRSGSLSFLLRPEGALHPVRAGAV